MLPAAHIVLYLIGTLLGVWAASLVVRGIAVDVAGLRDRLAPNAYLKRPRWLPRDATARDRIKRRIAVVLGLFLLLDAAGIFVAGLYVREWTTGVDLTDLSAWKLGTIALIFLGLATAFFGWRADPSRGRRRCPKCWYDMSGSVGRLCPECGNQAKSEDRLFRTRRSKGLFWAAALMMLGAIASVEAGRIRENGWLVDMPSTVLIAGMNWLPEQWIVGTWGSQADDSLSSRARVESLGRWERAWLTKRCNRNLNGIDRISPIGARAAWIAFIADLPVTLSSPAAEAILSGLCDPDPARRVDAIVGARVLAQRLDWQPELKPLVASHLSGLAAALRDSERGVTQAAFSLLEQSDIDRSSVVRLISDILHDGELTRRQRADAAWSLANLGLENSVARDALVAACLTGDAEGRLIAIPALGQFEALGPLCKPLMQLLSDPDDRIANSTIAAVRYYIGGQDWFADVVRARLATHPLDPVAFLDVLVGHVTPDDALREDLRWFLRNGTPAAKMAIARYLDNHPRFARSLVDELRFAATDPGLSDWEGGLIEDAAEGFEIETRWLGE